MNFILSTLAFAMLHTTIFGRTTVELDATTSEAPNTTEAPVDPCIESCFELEDGNYQSCLGCDVFASCSAGKLTDGRSCPSGLVWDDQWKECAWVSTTCTESEPTTAESNTESNSESNTVVVFSAGRCVSSCEGMRDGDYQSCKGCHVYATCANQLLFDERPCPLDFVWDDDHKRCLPESGTCPEPEATTIAEQTTRN